MMLFPACVALAAGSVIARNVPEIRDTITSHDPRAYGGTAMYLATASITSGMKLWLAALAVRGAVRATARQGFRYGEEI